MANIKETINRDDNIKYVQNGWQNKVVSQCLYQINGFGDCYSDGLLGLLLLFNLLLLLFRSLFSTFICVGQIYIEWGLLLKTLNNFLLLVNCCCFCDRQLCLLLLLILLLLLFLFDMFLFLFDDVLLLLLLPVRCVPVMLLALVLLLLFNFNFIVSLIETVKGLLLLVYLMILLLFFIGSGILLLIEFFFDMLLLLLLFIPLLGCVIFNYIGSFGLYCCYCYCDYNS